MEICFLFQFFFFPIHIYHCQCDTNGEKNAMVTLSSLSSKCIIMRSVFLGQFEFEMEIQKMYSKKTLNDFDYLWIVIYALGVTAISINRPAFPHVTCHIGKRQQKFIVVVRYHRFEFERYFFFFRMASFWGWNHIEKPFLVSLRFHLLLFLYQTINKLIQSIHEIRGTQELTLLTINHQINCSLRLLFYVSIEMKSAFSRLNCFKTTTDNENESCTRSALIKCHSGDNF